MRSVLLITIVIVAFACVLAMASQNDRPYPRRMSTAHRNYRTATQARSHRAPATHAQRMGANRMRSRTQRATHHYAPSHHRFNERRRGDAAAVGTPCAEREGHPAGACFSSVTEVCEGAPFQHGRCGERENCCLSPGVISLRTPCSSIADRKGGMCFNELHYRCLDGEVTNERCGAAEKCCEGGRIRPMMIDCVHDNLPGMDNQPADTESGGKCFDSVDEECQGEATENGCQEGLKCCHGELKPKAWESNLEIITGELK